MKKAKKTQEWKQGDCFSIPLLDGTGLLGQVLSVETSVLNSVSCGLFNQRISNEDFLVPNVDLLFSTLFTTRDLLDSGHWRVLGASPISVPNKLLPFEALRVQGFVGAKIVGSRNVGEFANAFCGLSPWDNWVDPEYLDRLLIDKESKPPNLVYKKDLKKT